jgi:Protein of unknown function (DUF2934)
MEKHLEQRIRERAYEIWDSESRFGNSEDHWSRTPQGHDAAGAQTPDDTIINELGDFA